MAESVGQVNLDLMLNTKQFNKQINGVGNLAETKITSAFSKIGTVIAGAFAVKKIVDFGASCIELGSDLSEVQNVVDTTFKTMSSDVDNLAKTSITSLGMSQTKFKQTMSISGAMAESFGFTEQQAFNMAKSITNLAADTSSFYNISQDEAFTKLKSIFTGETESLKELGIVMTQNALDAFALSKGYGKTTNQMTEQEKVALRYAFVLDKLSLASGDFQRTQSGWANQTRILNEQWSQLKATIGQGLINIFTPVLKLINSIILRVQVLADAFLNFSKSISGNSSSTSSSFSALANTSELAASNISDIGDATQASAKKAKKSLFAFDELNKLSDTTDISGAGVGIADTSLTDTNTKPAEENTRKISENFTNIINKTKEAGSLFKQGFETGIAGNKIDEVGIHIQNIGKSIKEIFEGTSIGKAIGNFVETFIKDFGIILGGLTKFGIDFINTILSIYDWLLSNKTVQIVIKDIIEAFSGIINILSGILDFIAGVFSGNWDLAWQGIKEIFSGIIQTIVNLVKSQFDAIKGIISGVINVIKTVITTVFTYISTFLSTIWTSISTKISEIVTNIKNNILTGFQAAKTGIVTIFDGIKTTISNIFSGMVNIVKAPINLIISGINKVINGLNSLSIDVPDWVPEFGGAKFGINIPNIPKLADGGYVGANQPRLAVVGDNKTQGEIISPENKIYEVASKAIKDALNSLTNNSNTSGDLVLNVTVPLDGRILFQETKRINMNEARRNNRNQL